MDEKTWEKLKGKDIHFVVNLDGWFKYDENEPEHGKRRVRITNDNDSTKVLKYLSDVDDNFNDEEDLDAEEEPDFQGSATDTETISQVREHSAQESDETGEDSPQTQTKATKTDDAEVLVATETQEEVAVAEPKKRGRKKKTEE